MTIAPRSSAVSDILKKLLSISMIAAVAYFLYLERDQLLKGLLHLSIGTLLPILLTVLVQWIFRTSRDLVFLRSLGYDKLTWLELFLINNIQMAANHLPMRLGTMLAAGILKNAHQVSYKHFIGLFASQQLLVLVPVTFVSAVVVSFHPAGNAAHQTYVWIGLLGLSVAIVIGLVTPVHNLPLLPAGIRRLISQTQSSVRNMLGQSRLMGVMLSLSMGMFVASAVRMYLIYRIVLGVDIDAGGALIVATMIHLSVLVSVTPAGLGIREGLVGLGSTLVSIPASVGVIASLIERVTVLIGIVIVFGARKVAARFGKLKLPG